MNGEKKMIISIFDSHEVDGEKSCCELMTVGTLSREENGYSIVYTEQDEEMKSSVTTLFVEGEKRVTMTRTGEYNSEIVIEKDKRHNCHYVTPYGDFFMGVFARSISSKIGEDGGELEFRYTIDFNSGMASDNNLKITLKEAKQNVCSC